MARKAKRDNHPDFYETLNAQAIPTPVLETQSTTPASTLNWARAALVALVLLIVATLVMIGYNLLARASTPASPKAGTAATLTGDASLQSTAGAAQVQAANGQLQGSYTAAALQPVPNDSLQGTYNGPPVGQ